MPTAKKQTKVVLPLSAGKAAKSKKTTPSFANPNKANLKRADNIFARKALKDLERAHRRDEWRAAQSEAERTARSTIYDYVKDWPRKSIEIGKATEPFMKRWIVAKIGAPPVAYDDELAFMLEDLIIHGITLDCISTLQGMPGLGTLSTWLATAGHPFSLLYTQAKQKMVPFLEEQALTLARESTFGEVRIKKTGTGPKGEDINTEEVRTMDNVQRATLAFNAYQWTLAHLVPKKHGRQPVPDEGNQPLKDLLAEFRARSKELEDGE